MKTTLRFAGLAVLAFTFAGCDVIDVAAQSRAEGMFERTLKVDGPVELSVRTGSGDIHVRIGGTGQVQVVGRIRARDWRGQDATDRVRQVESTPPIEQTGNIIRIGDTRDDDRYRNIGISYELVVPAETQLTAQTGSGNQQIGRVSGAVRAQTGSGSIDIEGTGGSLMAQTGSGNIRVNSVSGEVDVQTGSGSVDVRQVVKANVRAQTGSGNVVLALPADAAFNLEARTGSGSIESVHPLTIQGSMRRNHISGTVRGGGNSVRITTGSGSIHIR